MTRITWLGALSLAPLVFSQWSCNALDCGPGTIERNGSCQVADSSQPPETPFCGNGTHYDGPSQSCISDLPPTVCDPMTSSEVPQPDGTILCVGTGGGGCELGCPAADTGKVTVCGVLYDAETDDEIKDGTGTPCDPGSPTSSGPCSITLQFYDALAFAQNPTGTTPVTPELLTINDCGHYVAKNIPAPGTGYLAVGVEDLAPNDNYTLTGVAIPAMSGLQRKGLKTYAVRNSSDDKWSSGAGVAQNFSQLGAYMPIFLYGDVPASGVVVTSNGSPVPTNNEWFFSDTDPSERAMIVDAATQPATGANGSAIVINTPLVNHSGQGGEPTGCVWHSDLAAAIAGVYFVQTVSAEQMDGTECP